ncbi:MAG: cyclic pyranopterin monophosphate synthase MoaC [Candidatus Thermoplasmatota archaeon]|nr:cyclic pyranopterin monophosphate synthase MoaC [Candidatus Thermoplasmatota archaeon]MCL5437645.1 cyclic pyranopterin monophosphate synthase MoaC [Candidatus Thermoplasmatota archaeon]
MIDISSKEIVKREATASGVITLRDSTVKEIREGRVRKGDPIPVARAAGIMAIKKTPDLIPYCHPIPIEHTSIEFSVADRAITCTCTVSSHYRTGVEMEAITGASVALLTIWDMVKYLEKDENGQYQETEISDIRVLRKVKGEPDSHQ